MFHGLTGPTTRKARGPQADLGNDADLGRDGDLGTDAYLGRDTDLERERCRFGERH